MDSQHSVTRLFSDLKDGDEQAADELVKRYLDRLIRVAWRTYDQKLEGIPRPAEDEEDAALSALDSFLGGIREGTFPHLQDRQSLWNLLVKITVRKVYDQRSNAGAQKRGGGKSLGTQPIHEIAASSEQQSWGDDEPPRRHCIRPVEQIIEKLPGPQAAAELVETYREAIKSLEDPELRQVAKMYLADKTKEEIAVELGITERTVFRKLQIIHERWNRRFADTK